MNGEISGWLASRVDDTPAPMLEDGATVGDFTVVGFLGRGGSGEVYRAEHRLLKMPVALKVLHRGDEAGKARFVREAEILANNRCPGFPGFFACGEADGRMYLATELLEERPLPSKEGEIAKFIQQVASAVGELHKLGYVHRDIKPSNILWRIGGTRSVASSVPVLIDLGLVKPLSDGHSPNLGTLSVDGGKPVGVGTPGYAAPEQFTGGEIGISTDIHALGVLLNECFGGNPPKRWASIVDKAASSIPVRRFKSTDEMCAAMAVAAGGRLLFKSVLVSGAVPSVVCTIWFAIVLMSPLMSGGYRRAVCGTDPFWRELAVVFAFALLTGVIPLGLSKMKKWAMRLAMAVGGVFAVMLLCLPFADAEHGYASFKPSAKLVLFFWFVPRSVTFLLLLFGRVRALFSR